MDHRSRGRLRRGCLEHGSRVHVRDLSGGSDVHIGRNLLRFLGIVAAFAFLTAETCAKDNLGKTRPGPVSFRISVAPNFVSANGPSDSGSLSADGRYACFASHAKNLANPTSS